MRSVQFSAGHFPQIMMRRDQPSPAVSETSTWLKMHLAPHPNLMLPPPKNYEEMKAYNKAIPSHVPTWRNMYLSEPPVTTVMLMVSYYYQAPPDSRNLFKVIIRDKFGVTLGLVYDTFAATMPAYDESQEDPEGGGSVVAHVCWFETGDESDRNNDSEEDGSENDGDDKEDSEEGSGGDDDDADGASVIYDSDGNESELGSDAESEAAEVDKLIKLHLRVMKQLKKTWAHKTSDTISENQSDVQQTGAATEPELRE